MPKETRRYGDMPTRRVLSEKHFFEPVDRHEHERANAGSGESDYCANCQKPFMAHYKGTCPR
jgi:hypothetical protein